MLVHQVHRENAGFSQIDFILFADRVIFYIFVLERFHKIPSENVLIFYLICFHALR